ncbi:MAG: hypothetical protein RR512_06515 [Coprobacillus sp.]
MLNLYNNNIKELINTLPYQEYQYNNKIIVWFYDFHNHKASDLYLNNLFVCDSDYHVLWNMRDVVGYDDVCVLYRSVNEESFYFAIFMGLGFTININTLEMISKVMTK